MNGGALVESLALICVEGEVKATSREEVDRASVTITIEANTFTLRLRLSGCMSEFQEG